MGILEDIQANADTNGDGKISIEDLAKFKDKLPVDTFDQLRKLADHDKNGRIDISDLKNMKFDDIINQAKDTLGGLFNK